MKKKVMPKFEALYYPNFEPPAQWLRSNLLFFDKIRTIVPDDVDFEPSKNILEILDLFPDAFETVSPKEKDKVIDNLNIDRMRKAFQLIKEQQINPDNIEITLYNNGKIQIANHTFLHDSKLSDEVHTLLNEFDLIKDNFSTEFNTAGIDFGNFHIVSTKAADVIVSHVADRIGRRYGWNTITDQNIDFTVNSLNNFDYKSIEGSNNKLISSIISCEIPQEIQYIPSKKYQELRDAYSDIREPFHRVIIELSNLYRLETIEDEQTLQKQITEITSEFNSEVEKFKKSNFGRTMKRWLPIGVGSLATITGATFPEPKVAITSAAISVVISVVQELSNKEPISDRSNVQRLIAKMEKDILKTSDIKRLI